MGGSLTFVTEVWFTSNEQKVGADLDVRPAIRLCREGPTFQVRNQQPFDELTPNKVIDRTGRLRQLLLQNRSRLRRMIRLCRWVHLWIEYIAVASSHRHVGLVHPHSDLAALARLWRGLLVITNAVLPPQFFGHISKCMGKILSAVGLIQPGSSGVG